MRNDDVFDHSASQTRRAAWLLWLLVASSGAACGSTGEADNLADPHQQTPATAEAGDEPLDAGESPDTATEADPPVPKTIADLVVDTDRNGKLEPTAWSDQDRENEWNATHGAVFLANVDDDDEDGVGDHEDDVVNGPEDALDLARIRVVAYAEVPASATAALTIDALGAQNIRLFRVEGGAFTQVDPAFVPLVASDIAGGVEFAIEGRYFVRSQGQGAWHGYVDIHLEVTDLGQTLGTDDVQLRVAPLVFMNATQQTDRIYVGNFDDPFVQGVTDLGTATGVPVEVLKYEASGYQDSDFDPWTQDHFEMGYTAMPKAGGLQKMLVAFRTPRVQRTSADVVFVELRGKDFGAVHVHSEPYDDATRSLDSTGNWDTVPPHDAHGAHYPLGRFLIGSVPARHADLAAEAFVEAQEVQPMLRIDTSWLTVGHVDEISSFVGADTPRGWRMLFARPALARKMLQDLSDAGYGASRLFADKWWWTGLASRTVQSVLGDATLMASNQEDQATLDAILTQLVNELELTADDIRYMPFLEQRYYDGLSVAYQPATVNLLQVNGHLLMAEPFGPDVNGVDPFKYDLDARLGPLGLTTHYVDDWDTYHRNNGDVHCGTNTVRVIPDGERWWESGR